MAGGGGPLEIAPDKEAENAENTNNEDVDIMQELQELNDKPNSAWMEYFNEHNVERLVKIREKLFIQAKDKYMGMLREHGIHEVPELSLTGRRGPGAHRRIVQDIHELNKYKTGESGFFPRETLSEKSRYVPLSTQMNQDPSDASIEAASKALTQDNELMLMKMQLKEKDIKIASLEEKLLRAERKIEIMESTLNTVKNEMDNVKTLIDGAVNNSGTTTIGHSMKDNTKPKPNEAVNNSNPANNEASGMSRMNGVSQTRAFTPFGRGRAYTKTNWDRNSDQTRDKTIKNTTVTRDREESQTDDNDSNSQIKINVLPRIPVIHMNTSQSEDCERSTKYDPTFSEVISRKTKKRLRKQEKENTIDSFVLRGASQERTIQMYVRNIEIANVEQAEAVKNKVNKYLADKGVKVFKIHVIKNRFVDTTVGCRVTIRENQRDRVERYGFWPDKIECRVWGRRRFYNDDKYDRNNDYEYDSYWNDEY